MMRAITWNELENFAWSESQSQAKWETPVADEWQQAKSDLRAFRYYRKNWDGFGADAPDPRVIDLAVEFLSRLQERGSTPPANVSLSPSATEVSFTWHGENEYHRAEIVDLSVVEWMSICGTSPPEFWDEPLMDSAHISATWDSGWQRESNETSGAVVSR